MTENSNSHSNQTTQNGGSPPKEGGGFSSVQAFALPAETWLLVKANLNKSELKVTLCVLLNYFQVGIDAAPMAFGEIVEQTGMSRSSVLSALESAIQRGTINRTPWKNQPRYEPQFKKNRTHDMTCSYLNTTNSNSHPDKDTPCHETEIELRREIFDRLLNFGLAYHVAQNISMTSRYPLEQIQNQLAYLDYEIEHELVPAKASAFPGYVVNRIKFNRIAPQGYNNNGAWYTQDELENLMER